MAKPSMIIDLVSKGPGEEDEASPLDEGEEDEEEAQPDVAAQFSALQAQIANLRRSVLGT